jgi:hypothetical protein
MIEWILKRALNRVRLIEIIFLLLASSSLLVTVDQIVLFV